MKWYAIKGPDGEIFVVANAEADAWLMAEEVAPEGPCESFYELQDMGYRCVEVEIAEEGAVCEWRFVNKDGMQYGWIGNCPNATLWYENPHGQNFAHCPYCGRLIVEVEAARTGEDKEQA